MNYENEITVKVNTTYDKLHDILLKNNFIIKEEYTVKDTYMINGVKSELVLKHSSISDRINSLIRDNTLTGVSSCGDNCYNLEFSNILLTSGIYSSALTRDGEKCVSHISLTLALFAISAAS